MGQALLHAGTSRLSGFTWIALGLSIVVVDFLIGPVIQFPVLFVLPVLLSAWSNGRAWGLSFAIVLPLIRLAFTMIWTVPWTATESLINAAIRIVVLSTIAILADAVAVQTRSLQKEVHTLHGLVPVCSRCGKVRDPEGRWVLVTGYQSLPPQPDFAYAVCPDCLAKHHPELAKKSKSKRRARS